MVNQALRARNHGLTLNNAPQNSGAVSGKSTSWACICICSSGAFLLKRMCLHSVFHPVNDQTGFHKTGHVLIHTERKP